MRCMSTHVLRDFQLTADLLEMMALQLRSVNTEGAKPLPGNEDQSTQGTMYR